ncbi:MAG: hypothetical protein ABW252_05285 [Polyangiales bacterium]
MFVGLPLEGRVCALSRATGAEVGALPAPPEGFRLPFVLHQLGPGRLGVLDAGGLPSPSPFVPVSPTIHEYHYALDASGTLRAEHVRSVDFAAAHIGFAEDFAPLPGGGYVLSDAVLGALWVVAHDGALTCALSAADGAPLACSADMAPIDVGGVPFAFSGHTVPGVSPLAVRGDLLYFYVPSAGALFSLPLSSLHDDRTPRARIADLRKVSDKPANVAVEQLLGLAVRPDAPDDLHIYAADSLQLSVVRIDPASGRREVVAADPSLFAFPSSLAFVPGASGGSLVVVSNQQHLTPLTNHALADERFVLPYLVTELPLLG